MELRARVDQALKQAMRDKAAGRLATLRLINAAIKDQEIAGRSADGTIPVGDAEIMAILAKMTKQRNESVRAYEEGGRLDLAERDGQDHGQAQGTPRGPDGFRRGWSAGQGAAGVSCLRRRRSAPP